MYGKCREIYQSHGSYGSRNHTMKHSCKLTAGTFCKIMMVWKRIFRLQHASTNVWLLVSNYSFFRVETPLNGGCHVLAAKLSRVHRERRSRVEGSHPSCIETGTSAVEFARESKPHGFHGFHVEMCKSRWPRHMLHPWSLTARPWKMVVGRRSFPFGKVTFQGRAVKLQGGTPFLLCEEVPF